MIALGSKVRDKLSSFEGTVTGQAYYLYGCEQILVTPDDVKDGAPVGGSWLDTDRFDVIAEGEKPKDNSAGGKRGGPLTCSAPPVR